MQVPAKGVYALEAVFELAENYGGEPLRIADIARRRNIPQKFLELILATLKQVGLVEARRGAEGGYMLAKPPSQVSVGDVLRAVEGSSGLRLATLRGQDNPFADLWRRLDDAVRTLLERTTFEDLVRAWREKQSLAAPYWEI
ncbi:MAG: Rrf2 family transcriptional regulator [Bryobacterales bacterium]|nr:Rrf2 family transcriptional regulator [Bryobacteraceae bacterium]MDW8130860.1 Rrf2 family transcriptional regulator [Bryobacterales bacterium]